MSGYTIEVVLDADGTRFDRDQFKDFADKLAAELQHRFLSADVSATSAGTQTRVSLLVTSDSAGIDGIEDVLTSAQGRVQQAVHESAGVTLMPTWPDPVRWPSWIAPRSMRAERRAWQAPLNAAAASGLAS